MIKLADMQADQVREFGHKLLNNYRTGLKSFENAAQAIVDNIYTTFQGEDDQPAFALVRIFRACWFSELPAEVRKDLAGMPSNTYWMALAGTAGDEPEWKRRQESLNHRAIPAGEDKSPMLSAALTAIGIRTQALVEKPGNLAFKAESSTSKYFFVQNAPGSPHIPAQDEFVKPFQIKSVLGLGSSFLSQSLYLLLAFSKIEIDNTQAQKFVELAAYTSSLLAAYDQKGILWLGA